MPFPPGARIGPYDVVDLLGVGGMGEVYRARDPRLAREIAVEVIRSALVADTAEPGALTGKGDAIDPPP